MTSYRKDYAISAVALAVALLALYFYSPVYKDARASNARARDVFDAFDVPDGENAEYYAAKINELENLKASAANDAAPEELEKIDDSLTKMRRALILAPDAKESARVEAIVRYAAIPVLPDDANLQDALDLQSSLERLAQERPDDSFDRSRTALQRAILALKVKLAVRDDDREKLESLADSFEDVPRQTARDGVQESYRDALELARVLADYDVALGNRAKRAILKGARLADYGFPVVGFVLQDETTLVELDLPNFKAQYDASLLNVPKNGELRFYAERLDALQNLNARVLSAADQPQIAELKGKIADAIYDVYELAPFALDFLGTKNRPSVLSDGLREQKFDESIVALLKAREFERAKRLASAPEFERQGRYYVKDIETELALASNDFESAERLFNEFLALLLQEDDDVIVVARLSDFFERARQNGSDDARKFVVKCKETCKSSFSQSQDARKRRLIYIAAFN